MFDSCSENRELHQIRVRMRKTEVAAKAYLFVLFSNLTFERNKNNNILASLGFCSHLADLIALYPYILGIVGRGLG